MDFLDLEPELFINAMLAPATVSLSTPWLLKHKQVGKGTSGKSSCTHILILPIPIQRKTGISYHIASE